MTHLASFCIQARMNTFQPSEINARSLLKRDGKLISRVHFWPCSICISNPTPRLILREPGPKNDCIIQKLLGLMVQLKGGREGVQQPVSRILT